MSAGYDDIAEIGILYDSVTLYRSRPDVEFYVEEARSTAGKVLELGCGTGRILIPVARLGKEITGVDSSPRMLAQCRARLEEEPAEVRSSATLVRSDMRDLGGSHGRPVQRGGTDLLCSRSGRDNRAPGARLSDAMVLALRARASARALQLPRQGSLW